MPDPIEIMARAMCISGGFSPDDRMPNDGPRWRYYVPGIQAALSALHEAGFVVVPVEPTEAMIEAGRWPAEDDGPLACYRAMIQAAQVPHDET